MEKNITEKRLRGIYYSMKYRCYNPKAKSFKNYGKKGITVCNKWLNDYTSFFEWAISNGYTNHLTLDRIDNNKGYSPDNCRWVTKSFNSAHTSRWGKQEVKTYTYKGETKPIGEWARQYGITYNRLIAELKKEKDIEKIINKTSIQNHIYLNKLRKKQKRRQKNN